MARYYIFATLLACAAIQVQAQGKTKRAKCGNKWIPNDYIWSQQFKTYYKHYSETKSWKDHEAACQQDSYLSHLATSESKSKNDFITNLSSTHTALGYGRLDDDNLAEFSWVSGYQMPNFSPYLNWYKTEPNSEQQRCVLIYNGRGKTRKGKWHDIVCDWAGMTATCEIRCDEQEVITTTTQKPTTTTSTTITVESTTTEEPTTTTTTVSEQDTTTKQQQTTSQRGQIQNNLMRAIDGQKQFLSGEHGNLFLMKIYEDEQDLLAQINSHGCWCGATTTTAHMPPIKGRPMDYLDKACRDWITCEHCNKQLKDGVASCSGTEDYIIEYSDATGWQCSTENNICSLSRCLCDQHLVTITLQTVDESTELKVADENDCERVQNNGPKKNKCCGIAPFYIKFSEETHTCENNNVIGL